MLALFFCGDVSLHIPCWLCYYMGNFSYTSCAAVTFMPGVSLTHPELASFLCFISYTSRAGFFFFLLFFLLFFFSSFLIWGVSLTHPVLALFFCGEFLLHTPCLLHFYLGSFSYTSRAGFIFMRGVSLTHPMLFFVVAFFFFFFFGLLIIYFLCGLFLLDIPCWLYFYLGNFSYTFRAGLIFIWGVSLTHPVLAFWCGEFLLHVPWRLVAALCWDFLLHIPWMCLPYQLLIKKYFCGSIFFEKENK